ncbi:hypothetical protein CAter282_3153 [Collimonas arenae]|uniref:Fimbrial protein n=1 Tax=Collimonas arenae TaxID=279058 RepID=A0A127QLD1_9BURK|nr:hypothetical protein [Collimonas arenae]AMP00969.1 hypothetical protein CAter10_3460 [Collimonas arenae]AMP10860.1 hypothetical protein CAter282_3153 [Collimonas arenae]
MTCTPLKLAAALVLLPLASAAMAATNGGTIHFVGSIVEPPCTTSMADSSGSAAVQVSIHCEKRSAFDVAFQRVGPNANSPTTISLTRDGKLLGSEEAAQYRIALQGQTSLSLAAKKAAAGTPLGPLVMTITYQ